MNQKWNRPALLISLLALVGNASAQSTVTLFGVIDTGISYYSAKSNYYSNTPSATGIPNSSRVSQLALSSSGSTSNRLGFRGSEDLGGGLSAGFWLETGFASDTGATLGSIFAFSRRSTLSLTGGFGEFRLGRDYTATFLNDTVMDLFSTTGVGSSLINLVGSSLAAARGPGSTLSATDNQVRASNAVSYWLPQNDYGINGMIQYAFHENVSQSDLPGSPSKRGRYIGTRVGYTNGPFDVAVAYGESVAADSTLTSGIASARTISTANIGASYDFGLVKTFVEVSKVQDHAENMGMPRPSSSIYSTNDRYNGAMLGVSIPIGVGLIKTTYAVVKYKADSALAVLNTSGAPTDDPSVNKLAIGYVHNLSKRTALYATIAHIQVNGAQKNPLLSIATGGPAYTSNFKSGVGYLPNSATGYDFGIRHIF